MPCPPLPPPTGRELGGPGPNLSQTEWSAANPGLTADGDFEHLAQAEEAQEAGARIEG
jgi:hypothetical protein